MHLTHFTNFNSHDIENNMLPQQSQKLSDFTNFPANIFLFIVSKKFALYHFLTRKNGFLEAL